MHYHGTPITPRSELLTLAGACFCVSYAQPQDIRVAHEIGQSVMLDNGAFTFWRTGRASGWPGFYRWADEWLDYPATWAVIPDVIDGDEYDNDALLMQWPFHGKGVPVWHLHEAMRRLLWLADRFPLVCFGSSGEYAVIGTDQWHGRVTLAFDELAKRHRRTKPIHMLRGLALAGTQYPFASLDSTNVARNHHRKQNTAAGMVQRIDAVQNPGRWGRA